VLGRVGVTRPRALACRLRETDAESRPACSDSGGVSTTAACRFGLGGDGRLRGLLLDENAHERPLEPVELATREVGKAAGSVGRSTRPCGGLGRRAC
jgi:hypothetical protein